MYKIAKEKLSGLFALIAEARELYLPVNTNGQTNFAAWSEEAEIDLDTLKTVKSPKDAFFPQSENLYTCVRDGKKIKVEPEALKEQDFVVFGMKACDVRGVEVLDKVFLADPVEEENMEQSLHLPVLSQRRHVFVRRSGLMRQSRQETFLSGRQEILFSGNQIQTRERRLQRQ